MTEKRFFVNCSGYICNMDMANTLTLFEVVEYLNNLYEENQRLIKMLDNIVNYMQREYREIPIDDFVEWWNNLATEGIDDD